MLIKVIIHEPYSFECCHAATMPFGTDSLAPVPPDNDVVAGTVHRIHFSFSSPSHRAEEASFYGSNSHIVKEPDHLNPYQRGLN